jgi:hypothetical protein
MIPRRAALNVLRLNDPMIRGKHRSCIWFSIIGKGVLNFVAFSPEKSEHLCNKNIEIPGLPGGILADDSISINLHD